jgi:hypothetical protein
LDQATTPPKFCLGQVFIHRVRNAELQQDHLETGSTTTSPILNYVDKIHTDCSLSQGEQLVQQVLKGQCGEDEPMDTENYRYQILNIWRNISDTSPIQQRPLVVLDTESPRMSDLHAPQLMVKTTNTGDLKWYFVPEMTKGEALVFVQYDSDASKNLSDMCLHSSFEIPGAKDDLPTRQSVEARLVIKYKK